MAQQKFKVESGENFDRKVSKEFLREKVGKVKFGDEEASAHDLHKKLREVVKDRVKATGSTISKETLKEDLRKAGVKQAGRDKILKAMEKKFGEQEKKGLTPERKERIKRITAWQYAREREEAGMAGQLKKGRGDRVGAVLRDEKNRKWGMEGIGVEEKDEHIVSVGQGSLGVNQGSAVAANQGSGAASVAGGFGAKKSGGAVPITGGIGTRKAAAGYPDRSAPPSGLRKVVSSLNPFGKGKSGLSGGLGSGPPSSIGNAPPR